MWDWLQTRGRAILRLLSELGGALAFVTAAVALIAAAAAGAILVAVDVFPQPFLTFLVLGVAFLAAGLTLHFLRDPLAPPPSPAAPSLPTTLQDAESNPYHRATALQGKHDAAKARKALRLIREELRDNRRHVERASEGNIGQIRRITFQAWYDGEEALLELADSAPHSSARHAYRELEGIEDVLYIRESTTTLRLRNQPLDLLDTDVNTTFEAIDEAIQKLSAAENG